jgi:O-antigen/teichoic acid export membrane protein
MLQRIKYISQGMLSKAGDFLKTDIRYVVQQGSWLAGGEVINNILSIVLIISFANLLPASTYGTYKYILSIYGIFSLFGLSGAGPAIIKAVAEGHENIFKPALKTQIKWGFLGSLCLILVASYYFLKGNDLFAYSFIIAAIALPFFESLNTYQHILAGKKRFDLQTKYYSGTRIFSSLSLIASLFFTNNVLAILTAYFIPYILANAIFGYLALKKVDLNDSFDPSSIKYIKHLSLVNVIAYAVNYLDGIIVFHFLGPINLAVYSIASAPSTRLQSFFSIIPDISLPKYTERPISEIKASILAKIFKAIPFCLAAFILYAIAVPFFFKWFLPQYIDATWYAILFAIPLIWYPAALLPRVLQAKGATKLIYYSNIVGSALQLGFTFLGLYLYGLFGVILFKIIYSLISYVVFYRFFFKKL